MGVREELRNKWQQAAASAAAGTEWRAVLLSGAAPVRIAAGVREPDGRVALLFEAQLEHAPPRIQRLQAEGVSIADQRRKDENAFRLAVVLEHENLGEVFEVLAEDLITVARQAQNAQAALAAVVRRLEAWQACLRARRQRLSREHQIGLMGELAVCRILMEQIGHLHAIQSWQGPLDGIHDFSRAGVAVEVKAILGIGSHIRVSHLDQLRTDGISLAIARLRFRESSDGPSLADEVSAFRALLDREAPHARNEFDERLLRAGYLDFRREDDDTVRAELHDIRGYEVREGFPRLTPASVPHGIADASYAVDENVLAPFMMDLQALRSFIGGMKGRLA